MAKGRACMFRNWTEAPERAWRTLRSSAAAVVRSGELRIDSFRRRRREHFSVRLLLPGAAEAVTIPSPPDGYYADPFVQVREGKTWLFVEEFLYARDRGHISVLGLDGVGNVISTERIVLAPEDTTPHCHASFPFVFDHGGKPYMLPETHQQGTVDLFVSQVWPGKWRLARRLLDGIDAVDSMVLQHENTWFLVTSVRRGSPNRHLEIYVMDDLLNGPLVAHPVNSAGLYGQARHGTGRNAGFMGRQEDGSLARLMQCSQRYYGEGLCPMRILELTRKEYREEPATAIGPFPGFGPGFISHHASRAGAIVAYDLRDRTGSPHI